MARVSLLNKWFKHFIDEGNRATYMNRSGSARAAGYKATTDESFRAIGYQNFTKLHERVSVWMEETGMSDNSLHQKFLQLKNAKETKFLKVKGYIDPKDLPPGITAIATSGLVIQKEGEDDSFSAGDTLIMTETAALGIQRQILDMGYKIKGTYKPEEINLNAKVKGIDIQFVPSPNKGEK